MVSVSANVSTFPDAVQSRSKDMEVDNAEPTPAPAPPAATTPTSAAAAPATEDAEELSDELKAALAMSMQAEDAGVEGAAGPGLPANFKGTYELYAVVTHKGREADGGECLATTWVPECNEKLCIGVKIC